MFLIKLHFKGFFFKLLSYLADDPPPPPPLVSISLGHSGLGFKCFVQSLWLFDLLRRNDNK